jgi:hypothetical protein
MDKKERLRIALHESLHALTGMRFGHIHSVTIWPSGATEVSFNLHPFTLARQYARTPDKAYREMVAILASHLAPHVITKCPLEGSDAELVNEWRLAYAAVPHTALHWKSVLDDARTAVHEWYATPGRKELVGRVATALEKRVCVHGDKRWRQFVQSCQPARQALRPTRGLDLNRAVENIKCLQNLYDWRSTRYAGAGLGGSPK